MIYRILQILISLIAVIAFFIIGGFVFFIVIIILIILAIIIKIRGKNYNNQYINIKDNDSSIIIDAEYTRTDNDSQNNK